MPFHCLSSAYPQPFPDLSLPFCHSRWADWARAHGGPSQRTGGKTSPLPCVSTACVPKTPPFAVRFHFLHDQDTAFALRFHCMHGQDNAVALRFHCLRGQDTAFAVCCHCLHDQDTAVAVYFRCLRAQATAFAVCFPDEDTAVAVCFHCMVKPALVKPFAPFPSRLRRQSASQRSRWLALVRTAARWPFSAFHAAFSIVIYHRHLPSSVQNNGSVSVAGGSVHSHLRLGSLSPSCARACCADGYFHRTADGSAVK